MQKQSKPLIYEALKRRIIEMEMKPGDPIIEKELSAEFGVSRTPVREALIKLTQIDLVEFRPRVGTFVTQIDIATVKNAYEVKKNLEAFAAELAARRASEAEVKALLATAPGLIVQDDLPNQIYPMPLWAHEKDEVFVGRIRRDETQEKTLNMWIVSDNLRKGAATNAVQIAEYMVANGLL